jgi:hypothetical protein
MGAIIVATTLFQPAFGFVLSPRVSADEVRVMFTIFLALVPFYGVLTMEVPFVNLTLAMKQGGRILRVNALFVALYAAVLYLVFPPLQLYALPFALLLAQLHNALHYMLFVQQRLPVIDPSLVRGMVRFGTFLVVFLAVNVFLREEILLSFFANAAMASLWWQLEGSHARAAFRHLTAKGEVQ